MTLFSLVKKNLIGNARSYLLYFISLVLSVVIYFTFVSLMYSSEIQASMEIQGSIRNVFLGASILLILFVAVFIWYSNGFFTKLRKKEVGLYTLLGVRKRTVGQLLFYENLMLGAAALAAGILLGTLLSKMFTMIFLRLLDSAVEVSFRFSGAATVNTVTVFMLLILLVSVRAYRLVYRFRLIELFQAEQEGEHAPRTSLVAAIAGAVLLAGSYWIVFQSITTSAEMGRNLLLFLVGLIAGTYLLFRSGILRLLQLAKRNKSRYYAGMSLVAVSQLVYRMKGNTRTLTMIALLSAMALSAVSTGYILYTENGQSADKATPFSYSWVSSLELDKQAAALIEADKEHPVTAHLQLPVIRMHADVSKLGYIPSAFEASEMPIRVISASTYNEAAAALDLAGTASLRDHEAAMVRPRYTSDLASENFFGKTDLQTGQDNKGTETASTALEITKVLDEHVLRWGYPDLTLVVSDSRFAELAKEITPFRYEVYKVEGQRKTGATTKALQVLAASAAAEANTDDAVADADSGSDANTNANADANIDTTEMSAFYSVYREGLEEGGLNLFILGFLGLVFLAATGSIIYFKQLTEAYADRERYAILRNIGVSRQEIRRTVAFQSLFIFALPLIVGIAHSAMILKVLVGINLITTSWTVVGTMLAYIVLYAMYYVFTVASVNRIVNGTAK